MVFASIHSINTPYIVMFELSITHIARELLMHSSFGT
jgi:hypothetical protein